MHGPNKLAAILLLLIYVLSITLAMSCSVDQIKKEET